MASTPKMEYQVFLCIFQKNSAMATLGLKEMGKFLWEGREKGLSCWLSQFSKTGLEAMPLFLLDDLLNHDQEYSFMNVGQNMWKFSNRDLAVLDDFPGPCCILYQCIIPLLNVKVCSTNRPPFHV